MMKVPAFFGAAGLLWAGAIAMPPEPERPTVGLTTPPDSQAVADAPASAMMGWALTSIDWADIPQPADNPITEEKVELGAMLFFEPRLSGSNAMSCGTCHQPDKGYSDGRALFVGDHGEAGERNTQTVTNLAWTPRLFWDGRVGSLEEQALGPVASTAEMRQDLGELAGELEAAGYGPYFERAFGTGTITEEAIAQALATFQRTLVSHDAPFDRYVAGDASAMTAAQVRGMRLFETKGQCAECHSGPHFTDGGFYNIGVDTVDVGRQAVLPLPSQRFAFKTPGLRDVAHRAPYLHDGSAATLREVVEFYNAGGHPSAQGQPNLAIEPLGLTEGEVDDIVAFLEALTGRGAHGLTPPPLPSERAGR